MRLIPRRWRHSEPDPSTQRTDKQIDTAVQIVKVAVAPEDHPDVPGAEGGSCSPSADRLPGLPARDSAELGDTDQHSDA